MNTRFGPFPSWQPIEDIPNPGVAPFDGRLVLVVTVHDTIEITYWYTSESVAYEPADDGLFRRVVMETYSGWNGNKPTHWMPLPDFPRKAAP